MAFFDPLEQFLIEVYSGYFSSSLSVAPYTVFSKMVFFNLFLIIIATYISQNILKQSKAQRVVMLLFEFVVSTVKSALSVKKYSMMPLFFVLFLFIFFSNILGMIPYSMTITSHFILTIFLSLGLFLGTNFIGIYYHKERIFLLFLPEGVPVAITPILILIEYVSYFAKIFSLAIRLFANLMAGHILLKILIGFIWAIVTAGFVHWFWIILPLGLVFIVIGLEFCIAFLQAYVFLVLGAIYLNDAIHPH